MKRKRNLLFSLLCLIVLCSCTKKEIYYNYIEVEPKNPPADTLDIIYLDSISNTTWYYILEPYVYFKYYEIVTFQDNGTMYIMDENHFGFSDKYTQDGNTINMNYLYRGYIYYKGEITGKDRMTLYYESTEDGRKHKREYILCK